MLAADSVYRSVRMLPNKLKYDYERKKIAQGIKKNEIESRQRNLLSDGEDDYDEDEDDENDDDGGGGIRRGKRRGGRIPLLPDSIYSRAGTADSSSREGYDDYDDVIEYGSTGSGSYNTPDGMSGSYSDNDGGDGDGGSGSDGQGYKQQGRRTKRVVMKITEEDASASASLIQALTAFSSEVIEGGELMKLKKEFSWAVSVAQETLDLEILESGKRSSDRGKVRISCIFYSTPLRSVTTRPFTFHCSMLKLSMCSILEFATFMSIHFTSLIPSTALPSSPLLPSPHLFHSTILIFSTPFLSSSCIL